MHPCLCFTNHSMVISEVIYFLGSTSCNSHFWEINNINFSTFSKKSKITQFIILGRRVSISLLCQHWRKMGCATYPICSFPQASEKGFKIRGSVPSCVPGSVPSKGNKGKAKEKDLLLPNLRIISKLSSTPKPEISNPEVSKGILDHKSVLTIRLRAPTAIMFLLWNLHCICSLQHLRGQINELKVVFYIIEWTHNTT